MRQRYPFSLYAYVLMSNHFHLLLEVDRFPTARILQSLLTGYVRRFNKIHRYDVKIIETKFYDQVLQSHICCNARREHPAGNFKQAPITRSVGRICYFFL